MIRQESRSPNPTPKSPESPAPRLSPCAPLPRALKSPPPNPLQPPLPVAHFPTQFPQSPQEACWSTSLPALPPPAPPPPPHRSSSMSQTPAQWPHNLPRWHRPPPLIAPHRASTPQRRVPGLSRSTAQPHRVAGGVARFAPVAHASSHPPTSPPAPHALPTLAAPPGPPGHSKSAVASSALKHRGNSPPPLAAPPAAHFFYRDTAPAARPPRAAPPQMSLHSIPHDALRDRDPSVSRDPRSP